MGPRKRAAEDDAPQRETRAAKSRRLSNQENENPETSQGVVGKEKENENTGFKWSRDVKGTADEGRTMTLGPGEWDSEDDLQLGGAGSEDEDDDDDSISESDEVVESDGTGARDAEEGGADESDSEEESAVDKDKVHNSNTHLKLFTHRRS